MTGPPEFFSKRSTLIKWWLVHRNFLFQKVHPHLMTGLPEFFVPKGPPSSRDDRSTETFCSGKAALTTWWQVHQNFLFQKVHPHHAMTGPPENLHSGRSTLITWWQVHRNFLFQKVHPHHAMTGPPEYLHSGRSTLITWWQVHRDFFSLRSALRWWGVHRKFLFRKVHPHHMMTGPCSDFVKQYLSMSVWFSRFAACFLRNEAFVA